MFVLGGIFDNTYEDTALEDVLKYVTYRLNDDELLLSQTKIVYDLQRSPADNSFLATKRGRTTEVARKKPAFAAATDGF